MKAGESKVSKKNQGSGMFVEKLLKPAYSFSQAQDVKLVDWIPGTLHSLVTGEIQG